MQRLFPIGVLLSGSCRLRLAVSFSHRKILNRSLPGGLLCWIVWNRLKLAMRCLGRQLADPEVLADHSQYQKIAKQHRDLEPVVSKYREYRQVLGRGLPMRARC